MWLEIALFVLFRAAPVSRRRNTSSLFEHFGEVGQLHPNLLGDIGDAEIGVGQLSLGVIHPFQLDVLHRGEADEFLEIGNEVVRM